MKRLSIIVTVLFAWLAFAPASHATLARYEAILSGPAEATPNASPGTGIAIIDYDSVAHTMRVQALFSGLLGTTTAAHIHCCTAVPNVGTAGVATTTPTFTGFPGGVTSGAYDHTFDMTLTSSFNPSFITAHGGTTATAEADLFSAMDAGKTYFNIHTTAFPGGEIRGFLHAVPEPGTLALFTLALAGAGFVRRRKV